MVPANPCPPNQPKTFWAPCGKKTDPRASRSRSRDQDRGSVEKRRGSILVVGCPDATPDDLGPPNAMKVSRRCLRGIAERLRFFEHGDHARHVREVFEKEVR